MKTTQVPEGQTAPADYFTAPMYDGEVIVLAQLLVRYHNSITEKHCSLYGAKMDKALCTDTFRTLFVHPNCYEQLCELRTHFAGYETPASRVAKLAERPEERASETSPCTASKPVA